MDDKKTDYDENIYRWKPKISVKSVAKAISGVVDTGLKIIDNTVKDLEFFLRNAENCVRGCGVAVDKMRLRLIHRAIQYISLVTGVLCSTALIPTDIIDAVFDLVSGRLKSHRDPEILRLINPKESVWGINCDENNIQRPRYERIIPENFNNKPDRIAYVFIHGMCYKALKKDGSDFSSLNNLDAYDYFANFEREAKIFCNDATENPPDISKIDIYLVSYDSEMSDEDEELIRTVLKSYILGGGNFHLIIAAVFWKEMKRRADEAVNYIIPFLKGLEGNTGLAVTHSLGCYVLASASEKINNGRNPRTAHRSFRAWWCMSAALPSDAFSNTGNFQYAPLIAGTYDAPKGTFGTTVWFSLLDVVLMLIYPLAECTTALGLTGIGVNDNMFAEDYDITGITREHHGPDRDYIESLGPQLREILNTEN